MVGPSGRSKTDGRKFPKSLNLPGRENYWALDDINGWMKGDLARVAVTRPEDPGERLRLNSVGRFAGCFLETS